jgi:hypothetical protein
MIMEPHMSCTCSRLYHIAIVLYMLPKEGLRYYGLWAVQKFGTVLLVLLLPQGRFNTNNGAAPDGDSDNTSPLL